LKTAAATAMPAIGEQYTSLGDPVQLSD